MKLVPWQFVEASVLDRVFSHCSDKKQAKRGRVDFGALSDGVLWSVSVKGRGWEGGSCLSCICGQQTER